MDAYVHLEHFEPRSGQGTHEPVNVTLACEDCDALKANLTTDDLADILADADGFFTGHGRHREQREKLQAFAEVFAPRILGLSGYAARHDVSMRNARTHWEELRRSYRLTWQTSN